MPKQDAEEVLGKTDQVYFDPISFTAFDHPYDTYARLRDEQPVYFNERRKLWVISRYSDVQECLRNHEVLVNKFGNDIDGTHDAYGVGMLVCQDPPHHTVLRDALRACFSSSAIMAMEGIIREHARTLIKPLREKGGLEFTDEIALPLAFSAALNLVGAPQEEAPEFIEHLKRAMARTVGKLGVSEDAVAANVETEHRLAEIVDLRRRELESSQDYEPTDAITQILRSVGEGLLDDVEVVGLTHLVLSAATDAPAALLSNCIAMLDRFPYLQQHLAENPGKIGNFVEEVLRFDSPAQNLSRQAIQSLEIGGKTIPANSRVMLLLASANRDDRAFENPEIFDIDRDFANSPRVLAFGDGIHSCMGAPIARLTAKVFLEELLDGTEYRIEGMPERWVKQMVRGYSKLPISVVSGPDEALIGAEAHHESKMALTGHRHLAETPARLKAKRNVAAGVVELVLEPISGGEFPAWEPGAHIDLLVDGAEKRQYSLCGDPDDLTSYRIGVLREPNSSGTSAFIYDAMSEGDHLIIRGPRNNFPLASASGYIFIAGGIGITPMLPMIAKVDSEGIPWKLHYAGKSKSSMGFLPELARFGEQVVLWPKDENRRINLTEILSLPQQDTLVYSCGPESLLDGIAEAMKLWPEDSLRMERFSPKKLGEPVRATPFEVELVRSQKVITVTPEVSILEAVNVEGVDVLSSCKQGTCGTCETRVIAGIPDHRDSVLSDKAQAVGDTMMICVSRSCGDKLTLDL